LSNKTELKKVEKLLGEVVFNWRKLVERGCYRARNGGDKYLSIAPFFGQSPPSYTWKVQKDDGAVLRIGTEKTVRRAMKAAEEAFQTV